jgi:hypothetical protein
MAVLWDVAPCSLVDIDRRFWGAYCLHHQCDETWWWRQWSPLKRRSISTRLQGPVLHLRRQPSSYSSLWELQISPNTTQLYRRLCCPLNSFTRHRRKRMSGPSQLIIAYMNAVKINHNFFSFLINNYNKSIQRISHMKVYRICACISRTFWQEFTLQNWVRLYTEHYVLFTTEPATPELYVVKLLIETASVWDCYLASYCTRANAKTFFRCIGVFWLHERSLHHRFPEVGRQWHHRQITVNAASNNQSAANAIGNIVLSHR